MIATLVALLLGCFLGWGARSILASQEMDKVIWPCIQDSAKWLVMQDMVNEGFGHIPLAQAVETLKEIDHRTEDRAEIERIIRDSQKGGAP